MLLVPARLLHLCSFAQNLLLMEMFVLNLPDWAQAVDGRAGKEEKKILNTVYINTTLKRWFLKHLSSQRTHRLCERMSRFKNRTNDCCPVLSESLNLRVSKQKDVLQMHEDASSQIFHVWLVRLRPAAHSLVPNHKQATVGQSCSFLSGLTLRASDRQTDQQQPAELQLCGNSEIDTTAPTVPVDQLVTR